MKIENECDIKGRTILVTGASSGIGAATALALSQRGATIVVTGRSEDRLKDTFLSLHGTGHLSLIANLADENQRNELVAALPSLDGLVYCAGVTSHLPVKFIRQKNLDEVFGINVHAAILLTAQLLTAKKISPNASLVYISSLATRYPYFGGSLYGASKSALEGYVKYLAFELATKKIRANLISPAFVETKMVEETEKLISKETLDKYKTMNPLGTGTPADVIPSIVYLLSESSKWVSGSNLILGGG